MRGRKQEADLGLHGNGQKIICTSSRIEFFGDSVHSAARRLSSATFRMSRMEAAKQRKYAASDLISAAPIKFFLRGAK